MFTTLFGAAAFHQRAAAGVHKPSEHTGKGKADAPKQLARLQVMLVSRPLGHPPGRRNRRLMQRRRRLTLDDPRIVDID
jgi:hypothetical protein